MDARSSSAPRSATEGPSGLSTGIGPGGRTLGDALVKKWRKRLTRSVSFMTPLCCVLVRGRIMLPTSGIDIRVTQRIVEMRFAPPENLKRVPGLRALLYYLPRDEGVASSAGPSAPFQSNDLEDPARNGLLGDAFQRAAPPQ